VGANAGTGPAPDAKTPVFSVETPAGCGCNAKHPDAMSVAERSAGRRTQRTANNACGEPLQSASALNKPQFCVPCIRSCVQSIEQLYSRRLCLSRQARHTGFSRRGARRRFAEGRGKRGRSETLAGEYLNKIKFLFKTG